MSKLIPALVLSVVLVALPAGCSSDSNHKHSDNNSRTSSQMRGDVVARGKGEIGYVATAPGRVTVRNVDKNTVIITRTVKSGDIITVRPGRDEVLVNNTKVFDENLEGNDIHSITFNSSTR